MAPRQSSSRQSSQWPPWWPISGRPLRVKGPAPTATALGSSCSVRRFLLVRVVRTACAAISAARAALPRLAGSRFAPPSWAGVPSVSSSRASAIGSCCLLDRTVLGNLPRLPPELQSLRLELRRAGCLRSRLLSPLRAQSWRSLLLLGTIDGGRDFGCQRAAGLGPS